MNRYALERRQWVPTPLEETFRFYADPRNLARITPGWLGFRILGFDPPAPHSVSAPAMAAGLRIHYSVRPLGFPQRWTSRITLWDPPRAFVDEQAHGPYRYWRHLHEFASVRGGTELRDEVTYELPLGRLGRLAHLLLVRRKLNSIFDFRERVVAEMFGSIQGLEAS